jgi:hypothetical protein
MKFACEASASAVPVCVSGARGGHTPQSSHGASALSAGPVRSCAGRRARAWRARHGARPGLYGVGDWCVSLSLSESVCKYIGYRGHGTACVLNLIKTPQYMRCGVCDGRALASAGCGSPRAHGPRSGGHRRANLHAATNGNA